MCTLCEYYFTCNRVEALYHRFGVGWGQPWYLIIQMYKDIWGEFFHKKSKHFGPSNWISIVSFLLDELQVSPETFTYFYPQAGEGINFTSSCKLRVNLLFDYLPSLLFYFRHCWWVGDRWIHAFHKGLNTK